MNWDDSVRKIAVNMYISYEPNPSNTLDIVRKIAIIFNTTTIAIRLILTKEGVYIRNKVNKKLI